MKASNTDIQGSRKSKSKRRKKSGYKSVARALEIQGLDRVDVVKKESASSKSLRDKRDREADQAGDTSANRNKTANDASLQGTTTVAPLGTSQVLKRIKHRPPRFSHPQLEVELKRLRRPWLSPGDFLFDAALAHSYRGLRHVPAESLPPALHSGFRRVFDSLHEAGLFLYDTVKAGGKRLSRTFVTRTLVGDPGITYKYLGLRLFAHPWDSGDGFWVGPGNGLAEGLNDPCFTDLFCDKNGLGEEDNEKTSRRAEGVGDMLCNMGRLSKWMQGRASKFLKESTRHLGVDVNGASARHRADGLFRADGVEATTSMGSCDFNLTLINRMECSAAKRDLKPDPLFAMGKCSVSWHADSCLEDFSTIGVYHCTEPVPEKPDWGIAVRVSQEAEERGDDAKMGSHMVAAREQDGVGTGRSGSRGNASRAEVAVLSAEQEDVSTPPLLVPLQSGDAYFLLDDFNHFHEHAVVSGSSTLRYSSTHRVASTEGNTFAGLQRRCEAVLAGEAGVDTFGKNAGHVMDVAQVRAEQALLTELESEWLNQFWVQGRRHALLHPWWRGPMALVLATWRELERRTAATVQHLLSVRAEGCTIATGGGGRKSKRTASSRFEPAAIARAFDTVIRALEERRENRSKWGARFADPAYHSLPSDCAPVVPALWSECAEMDNESWISVGRDGKAVLLPEDLGYIIGRLRDHSREAYRAASGGKKAESAKAIASGGTSNWELFQAGQRPSHPGDNKRSGLKKKRPKKGSIFRSDIVSESVVSDLPGSKTDRDGGGVKYRGRRRYGRS